MAAAAADSSRFIHWSAVFSGRMDLYRSDVDFPWNASSSDSVFTDRVSGSIHAGPGGGLDLFLKIGSGIYGGASGDRPESLIMEQCHLKYRLVNLPLEAVFFVRERIFGPWTRLLPVISDDSRLLPGAAGGIGVTVGGGRDLRFSCSRTAICDRQVIEKHGGLPVFEKDGDRLDFLECSAHSGYGHLGLTLSSAKSSLYGDAAVIGAEVSLHRDGLGISAGFARSVPGGWDELKESRIFDIDPSAMGIGNTCAAFAPGTAFAAEVSGIEYSVGGAGKFGLIPSYRYYGRDFTDPQGEIYSGLVESRATSYWKHPSLAIRAVIDVYDRYSQEEKRDGAVIAGYVRTRFKRGFETSEGIIMRDDMGPSIVISMLDESERMTMSVTARFDERGDESDLSFLAEGGLKTGHSWVIRNCVFLRRSIESFYNIALEFRPASRFLFTLSAGSFRPWAESITMMEEPGSPFVREDRFISISTRIWMGGF